MTSNHPSNAIRIVLILLLFIISPITFSSDSEIILHTVSIHAEDNEEQNNINYGIGYETKCFTDNICGGGYYRNSQDRNSFYLSYGNEYNYEGKLNYGWQVLAVTGYEDIPYGCCVPAAYLEYGAIRLNVLPFPGVLHLGFAWNID